MSDKMQETFEQTMNRISGFRSYNHNIIPSRMNNIMSGKTENVSYWMANKTKGANQPKITEKVKIIIPEKDKIKREFDDEELEKEYGRKSETLYLDEEMSKRFVCDGATLICKHLFIAKRLILRVTDKRARLQGGNPIATEDDVLPENFEFEHDSQIKSNAYGISTGVNEKTPGMCRKTGKKCMILNAYWTKLADSILNSGKAMVFDTSELYCMVDENSPITIEYNGQDYTKFEGGWNQLTRTHKNNPVLYNIIKSGVKIYFFGDVSVVFDIYMAGVSYLYDESMAFYSEIGYMGPSKGLYEDSKNLGDILREGVEEYYLEKRKGAQPYKPKGKIGRRIERKNNKKNIIEKGYKNHLKEKGNIIYKDKLKNIRKNTMKNIGKFVIEKGADKIFVDWNPFIPTEARYNQSIDYFNNVHYIEDYTKEGDK